MHYTEKMAVLALEHRIQAVAVAVAVPVSLVQMELALVVAKVVME